MNSNPLRIAIVGGGIGGVAAANALLRLGMDVRLYEQAPALTEVGAGVAIQPNGVRMLRRLGLGDELLPLRRQVGRSAVSPAGWGLCRGHVAPGFGGQDRVLRHAPRRSAGDVRRPPARRRGQDWPPMRRLRAG